MIDRITTWRNAPQLGSINCLSFKVLLTLAKETKTLFCAEEASYWLQLEVSWHRLPLQGCQIWMLGSCHGPIHRAALQGPEPLLWLTLKLHFTHRNGFTSCWRFSTWPQPYIIITASFFKSLCLWDFKLQKIMDTYFNGKNHPEFGKKWMIDPYLSMLSEDSTVLLNCKYQRQLVCPSVVACQPDPSHPTRPSRPRQCPRDRQTVDSAAQHWGQGHGTLSHTGCSPSPPSPLTGCVNLRTQFPF